MHQSIGSKWTKFTLAVAILFTSAQAMSQETKLTVVTSIKPLQLITQELTLGVTDTQVLLNATASPHDYALRPSDMRKIKDADLFIWVGPGLESFLESALEGNTNTLQLDQSDQITKLKYGEEGDHDHADHDHAAHEDHDDGHHHHGGYNPHLWLGPQQAQQMAKVISDKLMALDPEHKATYQKNYQAFVTHLSATISGIKQQLAPVKSHGYYVFHDAYSYYENYFGLNNLGHFTVSPDRRPGAKTLITIRTALQSDKAYCVFSEPQFTPAVIDSVTRGTNVKHGSLDPLATDYPVKPGSYFTFLQDLGHSFSTCLTR
ncbi:zinc ABC transporter substrate-binding protein ZnuA [Vibrio sp. S11_S32]|uniref:zinc ABC transporter substrate-binding protein ZnuA n=1 Tax=Vibrio sp. S11_S32 TaxID=2720225 RepID=UPI00168194BD|nr:zinc ABC transporter substrate-binding protein ZnuA [Vibrio sp. S11_S32]MBD1575846.1 zinc ABC transporter substrate-binding protein ZnuA [Vibrio sp. S11_S32]